MVEFSRKELQEVSNILIKLGIAPNLNGYRYLRSSIIIMLHSDEFDIGFTTSLYPEVADAHNTKFNRVERSIRTAISCIDSGNPFVQEIMPYNLYNSYTNKQVICSVVDYIKIHEGA